MTLKRSCIPIELADEEERLNVLLHKAFEEISDEEFDRIGFDAFYDDFTKKKCFPGVSGAPERRGALYGRRRVYSVTKAQQRGADRDALFLR